MSTSTLLLRIYLALSFLVLAIRPSHGEVITNEPKPFFVDKAVEQFPKIGNDNTKNVFQLITHGRPGELLINGQWKSKEQIAEFLIANSQFSIPNSPITRLNIYGCEFGKGEKGREAVAYLEKTLGIPVAASDDITGKDGDWELEVGNAQAVIKVADYAYNLQATPPMNLSPTSFINPNMFKGYNNSLTAPNNVSPPTGVAVNKNNIIGVVGNFPGYNGVGGPGNAKFNFHNPDISVLSGSFNTVTSANATVETAGPLKIIALRSGSFLILTWNGTSQLWRVDADGTKTKVSGTLPAVSNLYNVMIEDPVRDNIVYVGANVNNAGLHAVYKLNVTGTGTYDSKFKASVSTTGTTTLYDMAFSNTGKLIVSQMKVGVRAYDTTSTNLAATFTQSPVFALNNDFVPRALGVQSDGKIVVGGYDMPIGGVNKYLSRLNADLTLDTSFPQHLTNLSRGQAGTTATGAAITDIEIGAGDVIYVAGDFSHLQDYESQGSAAKLSKDGVLDVPFIQNFRSFGNASSNGNNPPSDIALQADGKLLITGAFGVNNLYHNGLNRLHGDGILDVPLYASSSPGTSQLGLSVLMWNNNRQNKAVVYRKGEEAQYNINGYHPSYYGRTNDNDEGPVGIPTRYDAAADKFIVCYPTVTNGKNVVCHNLDGTIKWSKTYTSPDVRSDGTPWCTDISHDGNYFVILYAIPGGGLYEPRLYNANTGALIKTITAATYYDVGFNKTGNYFYVLGFGTMDRYDLTGTKIGSTINCNNPYNNPGSWTIFTHFEFITDTDLYLFTNNTNNGASPAAIFKKILVTSSTNSTPNSSAGTYMIYDTNFGTDWATSWPGHYGLVVNTYAPDFDSNQNLSRVTVGPDGNLYGMGQQSSTGNGGANVVRIGPANIAGQPDVQQNYILTMSTAGVPSISDMQNQNLVDWSGGWSCSAGTTAPTLNGATATNVCPATTVNLTGKVTSTAPSGSHIVWSTSATASSPSDTLTNITAVGAGTYYAYYYDPVGLCYSPASSGVVVTINTCPTCAAGTTAPTLSGTSKSNVCPATTADLSGLVTSTCPSGSSIEWHTVNTGLAAANKVATPTAVAAGTYYAACYDATGNCYSPASGGVTVTINTCPSCAAGTTAPVLR